MAYQVIRLSENTYAFDEGGVRSFLVLGTKHSLLIDTGFGAVDFAKELPLLTDKPLWLVNTHSDRDHVGGNGFYKDEIFMHAAEIPLMRDELSYAPLPEGHVFLLGGTDLQVLHTPGHTPGSICLMDAARRALYAGDTLSLQPVAMSGDTRDPAAYVGSLKALAALSDRIDTIYPSHGPCPIEGLAAIAQSLIDGTERYMRGDGPDETTTVNWPGVSFEARLYGKGPGRIMLM